jgi:hypothetical protein
MLMLLCTRAVRRFIFIVIYYETFDMATHIRKSELSWRMHAHETLLSHLHVFCLLKFPFELPHPELNFSSRNFC